MFTSVVYLGFFESVVGYWTRLFELGYWTRLLDSVVGLGYLLDSVVGLGICWTRLFVGLGYLTRLLDSVIGLGCLTRFF